MSSPDDPIGEMKEALFHTIVLEFGKELEKAHRGDISADPALASQAKNTKMIESKLMVYETCDTPVALLIFAPDAKTSERLEDYASMMFANIRETNLPTWVIGGEEEIVPDEEGIALILKVWPDRQSAKRISSLIFEPMMDKLQNSHCKQ